VIIKSSQDINNHVSEGPIPGEQIYDHKNTQFLYGTFPVDPNFDHGVVGNPSTSASTCFSDIEGIKYKR
jgi:hypothetical protein